MGIAIHLLGVHNYHKSAMKYSYMGIAIEYSKLILFNPLKDEILIYGYCYALTLFPLNNILVMKYSYMGIAILGSTRIISLTTRWNTHIWVLLLGGEPQPDGPWGGMKYSYMGIAISFRTILIRAFTLMKYSYMGIAIFNVQYSVYVISIDEILIYGYCYI